MQINKKETDFVTLASEYTYVSLVLLKYKRVTVSSIPSFKNINEIQLDKRERKLKFQQEY